MFSKWSDHTFDECPFCGGHTGQWAPTYAFNFIFMECSFCGGLSQSAHVQDGGTTFRWVIPDHDYNKMLVEEHAMVAEALYPEEIW